ncbi:MAG: hypothetical protein AAGA30_19285 [Planctomycetota bacterium]
MVELKQFVSETLRQIIAGVADAQQQIDSEFLGAAIAPSGQGTRDDTILNQTVTFDVAVMAESGTKTSGGIGITIGAINLGSTGKSSNDHSLTNRVQFSVPIHLPGQKRRAD